MMIEKMKLLSREYFILSDNSMGHISEHRLNCGGIYLVYFVEARYFGYRHLDKNGSIVIEENSNKFLSRIIKSFKLEECDE